MCELLGIDPEHGDELHEMIHSLCPEDWHVNEEVTPWEWNYPIGWDPDEEWEKTKNK